MANVPARIAHYRIDSILGQGGMGVVYLAEDEMLHRRVAIKFLPPGLAGEAEARRRFVNEGRAAATLTHPNVAVVYEVGAEGDEMFLAMEYLPGPTLRDLVARGPVAWPEVIDIAIEVLAALQEAHGKGIVHRDIKGTNIKRLPDGRIKVMDFGLAKVMGGSTLTRLGAVVGTAAYMSPQQVCGEEVDARADLFSLGVLMYELLAGRLPFGGDHDVAVAHAILHEDPITIRELAPETPAELEHIVFTAMMKSLLSRYQSAAEMADDLQRLREHDRRRRAGEHEELDLIATSEVYTVRREQFRAPLVGREKPLARLGALHREARMGDGVAVCIIGEAGVGKSRLIDELRQVSRREGSRMLVASCQFGGGASSYLPFVEAFRQYFALRGVNSASTLQAFVVDKAPRLGGSLQVLNRFLRFTFTANGPTSEEELWEVLDQLLAWIAEERPLVLAIEDLQWADESSVRLFHFIARRAPQRRLMLVGTYRPEETANAPREVSPLTAMLHSLSRQERFERFELGRLDREAVDAILAALYPGHHMGADLVALLYRETEGNPFFLVELLKLLTGEGVLAEKDGVWTVTTALDKIQIPDKVYDVVMRRLTRLQQNERDILELGAVEGDVFHSGTILRGLRIERMALLKTLQFLEQVHHLIHAAGPHYHFDHAKIREILYDSIPPELRMEYHTVVGQFLKESYGEDDAHAGIIAHNLLAAGLREEALPFLIAAARASARLFAYPEAVHYLRRAEGVLHDLHPRNPPPERVALLADLLHQAATYEYAAGHYPAALARYESALDLARATGDAEREAELLRAIGRTQYLTGKPVEAQKTYDGAIAQYQALETQARAAGDELAVARALRQLAKLYFFRGDLDRSRTVIEEAIRLAEAHGDDALRAASLNNLAGVHYQRGELEEALGCHHRVLAIRERLGDEEGLGQTHKNIGIIEYRLGELRDAAIHLEEALTTYRKIADRRGEAVTLRHLGNLHYERGDHAAAQGHWESSLSLCRELGSNQDLSACLNNLGVLHLEQGRYATADRLFREVLPVLVSLGSKAQLTTLHINLGDLAAQLGELARAEAEYRKGEALALELEAAPHLAMVFAGNARIATERGDLEAARLLAARALEHVESTGHLENLIKAQLAAASVELASGAAPVAHLIARQARDTARWAHMGFLECQAGLLGARAAWRAGDGAAALAEIDGLLPGAEARGYGPLTAQCHHLRGQIRAGAGDVPGAADEYRRAGDGIQKILETLSDDDRRSFVHHPVWRQAIGDLLDTLIEAGAREEALGYLVPLGVGVCDVEPGRPGAVTAGA
ncbi:MAG: tetratricopeptide repeat protein [Candidatus Eisenbacteria bacterium]|nr:tetratricopeptide repeat protein [Candidatus Eisenbacteria bacterium]